MTTGPMDDEAKKRVWAMRTGIWAERGAVLPMLKERKRLKGKRTPNMREGGRV
jgi:hypothetical protein